jgi:hypothetical protein
MSNVLGSLIIRLAADTSDFNNNLKNAEGRLAQTANAMDSTGRTMTASVSAPLLGIGAAAITASTQMNEGLANVASLGIATDRVLEFKGAMQDMAIEVGKSTEDLSTGVYEVIGTFGDTSETLDVLKINAKAAAAGLATTQDAIKLTSAVTKAYGDTSADAIQKTADLAFQTVNLGVTSFPELAKNMGAVAPIAVALGVTQEELFGQMATLTGVTGNTSEVVTQLRATYQAILRPTTEMQDSLASVAIELEKQGRLAGGPLVDAWKAARATHDASAQSLADMRSQIESLEASMGAANSTTQALNEQIKQQRLEAKQAEAALKSQLNAIDTSTDAGKQQAAAIKEQLTQLKALNDQRELELQGQLLSAGGNSQLKEKYDSLNKSIKEQERIVTDQQAAVENAAAALGSSIVKSAGLNETLAMLNATTGGNTNSLAKMLGSVESLTAVLALSGGQAENAAEKYDAMLNVAGATDAAFAAQTAGLNKAGFTMKQVAVKAEVLMQKLGDGLAPALGSLLEVITPMLDKAAVWADRFANADASTQKWIVTIAALAAAAGPVLIVLSTLITVVSTMGGAISGLVGIIGAVAGGVGALTGIGATITAVVGSVGAIGSTLLAFATGPVGLTIAAVAALVIAWQTNFLGIRDISQAAWQGIQSIFSTGLNAVKGIASAGWQGITATWSTVKASALPFLADLWDGTKATFTIGLDATKAIALAGWQGITATWSTVKASALPFLADLWDGTKAAFTIGLDATKAIALAGWQGITATWVENRETVLSVTSALWDSTQTAFAVGMETAKGITQAAWQAINGDWSAAAQTLLATNDSNFARLNDLTGGRLADLRDMWATHQEEITVIVGALWQALSGDWAGAHETLRATTETAMTQINEITGGRLAMLYDAWSAHRDQLLSLAGALWEGAQATFGSGLESVRALLLASVEGMRTAWDTGLTTLRTLAQTAMEQAAAIFQRQIDAIKSLFTNFGWSDIGQNIVAGIAEGITSSASWLQDAASQAAQGALDAAKDWLGIQSPSEVAAEDIGVPFAEGIGEGALRGLDAIAGQLDSGLAALMGGIQPVGATAAPGGSGGINLVQNFYGAADPATVRGAAQDGVLAGLRQRGAM